MDGPVENDWREENEIESPPQEEDDARRGAMTGLLVVALALVFGLAVVFFGGMLAYYVL